MSAQRPSGGQGVTWPSCALLAADEQVATPGRQDAFRSLQSVADNAEGGGGLLSGHAGFSAALAERLVDEVAGRIRLMVRENWRFRPYYRQVRAWQDEGLLGPLTSGSIRLRSSSLLPDARGLLPAVEKQPFFRTERRLLVAETLIHHLDTARWLFGPLRLACATMQRTTDAVAGETAATKLLLTPEGAPMLVDGNLTCPGYPSVTRDRAEFMGTKGSVTFDNDRLVLHGPAPQAVQYEHDAAYQACFNAAIAHFAEAIRTGAPFETDGAENLETLPLVEAAYAAAGWDAGQSNDAGQHER